MYRSSYQETMVWIVSVRDGDVTQVVQITVVILIGAKDAGLHHVTNNIDSGHIVERDNATLAVARLFRVYSFQDSVPVPFKVSQIEPCLIRSSVDVTEDEVCRPGRKGTTSDRLVHLGEVGLWDGFTKVRQTTNSWQVVTETLGVISGHNLVMHVVEKLTTPVFVDCHSGTVKWVNQMPVPVMKIDTHIFAPVGHAVLRIDVGGCVVQRDLDGQLCLSGLKNSISMKVRNFYVDDDVKGTHA